MWLGQESTWGSLKAEALLLTHWFPNSSEYWNHQGIF